MGRRLMKADKNTVKHIASLARLGINEDELEKWSEQMGAIIGFADQLSELDLKSEDLDVLGGDTLYNVFREDEADASIDRDKLLRNAHEQYDGCYVVPRIVE